MTELILTTKSHRLVYFEHANTCPGCEAEFENLEYTRETETPRLGTYTTAHSAGRHGCAVRIVRGSTWHPTKAASPIARRLMEDFPLDDGAPMSQSRRCEA